MCTKAAFDPGNGRFDWLCGILLPGQFGPFRKSMDRSDGGGCCGADYEMVAVGSSVPFATVFQILFLCIQRLNYEEILPIYKTNYLIGQRFSGVAFRPNEEAGVRKVAESLTGRAKQKHTEWCALL